MQAAIVTAAAYYGGKLSDGKVGKQLESNLCSATTSEVVLLTIHTS